MARVRGDTRHARLSDPRALTEATHRATRRCRLPKHPAAFGCSTEAHIMKRSMRPKAISSTVESLEGRALLSGATAALPHIPQGALVGRVHAASIKTDPAGVAAVLNALNGGAGSEFITLIRKHGGYRQVISGFVSGRLTQYTIPGLAVRTPGFQPQYTGPTFDQLAATEAGALVLPGNTVELAGIMRGPFHDPSPSYYVFGIDRGAGASVGPRFAARPGITPDTLVTITAGPFGSSPTGTITDLTNGSTQTIDPSKIQIVGSTLRVFLDASQLPSGSAPITRYRFALWTQDQQGTDITTVASFVPDTMIPIGVLAGRARRR
jgi:hypothetical protein